MNTTENQLAIIEKPSDRKWPYVLGGFVAGVASIIGAAYLFDDEESGSSHYTEEIENSLAKNNTTDDLEDLDAVSAICRNDT